MEQNENQEYPRPSKFEALPIPQPLVNKKSNAENVCRVHRLLLSSIIDLIRIISIFDLKEYLFK